MFWMFVEQLNPWFPTLKDGKGMSKDNEFQVVTDGHPD
jgi:hypothetical protein